MACRSRCAPCGSRGPRPGSPPIRRAGGECPRKFLMRHPARLLEPVDPQALDNVNTPEEYAQALGLLDSRSPANPMQLKIQYYALMREQAGRSEETLETSAATPADLYSELKARYGFTLSREQLKVAVNSEFSRLVAPLGAPAMRWYSYRRWRAADAFSLHAVGHRHRGGAARAARPRRRRLRQLRGLGARSQRGPRSHSPRIRGVRGTRGEGRRAHPRRSRAALPHQTRPVHPPRRRARRWPTWRCGSG